MTILSSIHNEGIPLHMRVHADITYGQGANGEMKNDLSEDTWFRWCTVNLSKEHFLNSPIDQSKIKKSFRTNLRNI